MSISVKVAHRAGFTLVELLVVITIIGLLMGLLLPAVVSVREAARRTWCMNNLAQIGKGMMNMESQIGHYPSGGFGCAWLGDPVSGYGEGQPAGWQYTLLPFIDQLVVFNMPVDQQTGSSANKTRLSKEMCQIPISTYTCPSRRKCQVYPSVATASYQIRNGNAAAGLGSYIDELKSPGSFRGDYAINGGTLGSSESHQNWSSSSLPTGAAWETTGISTFRSTINFNEVSDGTSNTLMVAEKFMIPEAYHNGTFNGDNEPGLSGDPLDQVRWGSQKIRPRQDTDGLETYAFGSCHIGNFSAVFCDGSTKKINYSIPAEIFERLLNKADGMTLKLGDFVQ